MGLIFSRLSSLYDSLTADEQMRILMLGLDAAGKTTIMYKFKLNEVVSTIPTIGFNVETVTPKKGLTFTMWDVGGQTKIRPLWAHYYVGTQGLLYVVDSSDRERFEESRKELFGIIEADAMRGVPVIVLANKQDLPNAVDCSKIADVLHLHKLKDRKWHVQGCCATTGEGLYEGMDQLGSLAKQFRRQQQS